MRILTATHLTQGKRKSDFCFVPDGEIVTFVSECDGESVDGHCGCRRCLAGIVSHKSTTTFTVTESTLTPDEYADIIYGYLVETGWCQSKEEAKTDFKGDPEELLRLAAFFPLGAILEKRGNEFRRRV